MPHKQKMQYKLYEITKDSEIQLIKQKSLTIHSCKLYCRGM